MKKHRLTPIAALLLASMTFISCGKKVILDETRTFSNDTWMRFQPEHFDVTPASTDDCYNFLVTVTLDTARYRENGLPVMMELESPDHERRTLFSTILLRNDRGSWMGEFGDDGLLTVTKMVRQYYFFSSTATHSLNLGQRTSKYEIHGIRSLNLHIERAKLDIPN